MSGSGMKRVRTRAVGTNSTVAPPPSPVGPAPSPATPKEAVADTDDLASARETQARVSRYASYLRPVEGYIDGWIVDQNSPDESIPIELFIDQVEIATTVACLERPHLKKKFDISSSTHGFRVLVPNAYRDGKPHTVSLAVVGSSHKRDAREELLIPAGDVAPYLEIVAISEGSVSGRLYGAADTGAPELWIGSRQLDADDFHLDWDLNGSTVKSFRMLLHNYSAEDLLAQSAHISVAHGRESGHGRPLSDFVAPGIERISSGEIAIGAAIPFPVLDQARCRLELSSSKTFSGRIINFSVDLSLGVNDIILPADLREGEIWARLLLIGARSPIELLAPTLVPKIPIVDRFDPASATTGSGAVYVYSPPAVQSGSVGSNTVDPSIRLASTGTATSDDRLVVVSDGNGSAPFLRLTTGGSDPDTQLRFIFGGAGLSAGDLLHLRWFGRAVTSRSSGESGKQLVLSITADGASSGEAWAEAISTRPEWRDHHTILRIPNAPDEVAVEFTVPPGCMLDVGGLAVGKIAHAAETASHAIGDAATISVAEVLSYRIEQPLPAIALTNYRRFGVVANLDNDHVTGIAWSRGDVRRSTQLQLLVDGTVAGMATAEPLGGFAFGVSPGFFSAPLPAAARVAFPCDVDVQFMGTRESLRGVPRTLSIASRHDGVAWLTPEGDVAGWAADPDEAAGPIEVEIRADGQSIGRMVADAQHPMFSDAAHNNGRCAFRFSIPVSLRDGRLHTIAVRTSEGIELSGSPILATLKVGRSTVHLDPTLSGWVKGWVVTDTPPETAGIVDVAINGDDFGTIRAERSHDGGIAGGAARFRFSFRLPSHAAKVRLFSAELGIEAELDVLRVGDVNGLRPSEGPAPATAGTYAEAKAALLAAPEEHIDADWYCAMYPAAAGEIASGRWKSAAEHWLAVGASRGLNPNPWYDERWYLARNPDAAAAVGAGQVESGYLHWLVVGATEWRTPGPIFNPIEYRRAHPHAGDTALEETALDVVREWQADLATRERTGAFSPNAHAGITPPAPGRSLFRRAVTSRMDRTTVFDAHIGRLLEDLRVNAFAGLEDLRRTLDDNDVEIIRSVMNYEGLEEPLVSIIMPTFNRAYVIAEGIQSVLDQYWKNWELIICDDGSFDKTPKVVRQFTDPRIRYLQLEKANGAVARNFGIKFARGDYIAFLDSDNIWHPLFLTLTINRLRASSRPVAYTGYIDTNSNAVRYTEAVVKFAPFDYLALVAKNYIDLNSLVVRRELFSAMGTFDETLPRVQDWDLVLRLLRYFDPIELPCAVVFYRRNPSWGQVTELAAHTDFTKVVRQRALDRLRGHSVLETPVPPQSVSLYTGGTHDDLETSIAFAKLLSSVSDVVVLLPDSPAHRRSVERFGLKERVRLVWLRAQDRLSRHIVGGILFVPAKCSSAELDGIPEDHPVVEMGRQGERLIAKDRRYADDPGFILGALRLDVPDDVDELRSLDAPPQNRDHSAAVLTIAPMRQRWSRALLRRSERLQSTLFWYEGDQLHALHIKNGQSKPEVLSIDDGVRRIDRHSAILLAAGTGEDGLLSTSFGIAAQRDGVVLVVGKDELFENWATTKCAHLAPDDPDAAADLLIKVLDDHAASQRIKIRARRLFDYLYRSDVATARLSIAISLLNRPADA